MGGCNPCAAQYHHDTESDHNSYQYNQYYGFRPLDIYKKGESLIPEQSASDSEEDEECDKLRKEDLKGQIINEIEN